MPRALDTDFEVNPHLVVCHLDDGRVLLDTSPVEPQIVVDDARLISALESLPAAFTAQEANEAWEANNLRGVIAQLWDYCRSEGLVVPTTDQPRLAPVLHDATRDFPFLDMSLPESVTIDNTRMQNYLAEDPYPSVHLAPTGPSVLDFLPPHDAVAALQTGVRGESLRQAQLGLLLGGTFGQVRHVAQRWSADRVRLQVELLFKSIPSGGSRHPTECWLVLDVPGLPLGNFHYNVARNCLEEASEQLEFAFREGRGPHMLLVMAARVERAMWRYRDPRSARAVVLDVGHAVGQLQILSEWLGLEHSSIRDFAPTAVAECLGIDERSTPVVAIHEIRFPR